jgi:hypothetical protein
MFNFVFESALRRFPSSSTNPHISKLRSKFPPVWNCFEGNYNPYSYIGELTVDKVERALCGPSKDRTPPRLHKLVLRSFGFAMHHLCSSRIFISAWGKIKAQKISGNMWRKRTSPKTTACWKIWLLRGSWSLEGTEFYCHIKAESAP